MKGGRRRRRRREWKIGMGEVKGYAALKDVVLDE